TIKVIQVQTTSSKSFPGAGVTPGATPSVPKTAGEAKKRVAAHAPAASSSSGVAKPGETVGGKMTAPVVKATNDYIAAQKLDSLANQAVASHEPVQQRQLALGLIRGMAGRVNMQEFQQYTTKMGVPNTVEGLINGLSTGEMPSGIVEQLANAAHANLKASKDALDIAQGGTASSSSSTSDDDFLKQIK